MPKVVIWNMNTLEFSAELKKSLLQNILDHPTDWLHSCGGKGKCTTCKMIVKKGEQYLTPKSKVEKTFSEQEKLQESERLACQCSFKMNTDEEAELIICVAQENKLPHIEYSEC